MGSQWIRHTRTNCPYITFNYHGLRATNPYGSFALISSRSGAQANSAEHCSSAYEQNSQPMRATAEAIQGGGSWDLRKARLKAKRSRIAMRKEQECRSV